MRNIIVNSQLKKQKHRRRKTYFRSSKKRKCVSGKNTFREFPQSFNELRMIPSLEAIPLSRKRNYSKTAKFLMKSHKVRERMKFKGHTNLRNIHNILKN